MKNLLMSLMFCLLAPLFIYSAQARIDLRTAVNYAVFGGGAVSNTGPTVLNGYLGVSPGSSLSGFGSPAVVNGQIHDNDAEAAQAQTDATAAYNDAVGRGPSTPIVGNLGGQTLLAGVYNSNATLDLDGILTLDGQGDPDAVFIFQVGSQFTAGMGGMGASVVLIGNAKPYNVFWQVGSSATLETGTDFNGNIVALTSISLHSGATNTGSVIGRNGQVSLIQSRITASIPPPPTTPQLALVKVPSPSPFVVGEQGVFIVGVFNEGTAPTSGLITVTDILQPGLTYVSSTDEGGFWTINVDEQTQTVKATTTNPIAPGTIPSFTITVSVDIAASPSVTNTVSASGGGGPQQQPVSITVPVVTSVSPPTAFVGKLIKNEFLPQTDLIHHLTWNASSSPSVVAYLLYRNNVRIAKIPGTGPFYYNDHNRSKNQKDFYTLIAVQANGQKSSSATFSFP